MKWVGALMLGASSYVVGVLLAKSERAELDVLESLIAFLNYMRRRMEGERIPLYDVFSRYEDECLEQLGFLPLLRSCRNYLGAAWSQAISLLPISNNSQKELELFGESLGKLSFENQIKCIDICIKALEEDKENVRIQLPRKQKSIKNAPDRFLPACQALTFL